MAGLEGILEIVLCRDERDGSSVKVIVLYLSFVVGSDEELTVQLKLSGTHLPISPYPCEGKYGGIP